MLIKGSVKKPFTVLVVVVLVLLLGFVSVTRMTPDLLPSINLPYVMVMTSYPGASPEEVEEIVTKPVEQALATVENVESISSVSAEHYSMIVLAFTQEANMDTITGDLREKLSSVSASWDDTVGYPTILKINPDMLPVTVAAVDCEGMDRIALSSYVEESILPRLEGIEGVAAVSTSGFVTQQISITIDPQGLSDANDALQNSIREGFADGQAQLQAAIAQIEDGIQQAEDGEAQLSAGKDAIFAAQEQLAIQIAAGQQELDEKSWELLLTKKDLVDGLAQLTQQLLEAQSSLESLKALSDALSGLLLARQEALLQAAQLFPSLGEEALEQYLIENDPSYQALVDGIAAIDEQLAKADLTQAELPAAIEALEDAVAELKKGQEDLNATLSGLEEGLLSIQAAKEQLAVTEAQSSLEIAGQYAQLLASQNTLSATKAQLESSLAELQQSQKDLQEQQQTALEQADLENVLTMEMVAGILTAQNFSMPAGYVTDGETTTLVRVGDALASAEEISNLILIAPGNGMDPIRLGDVATIVEQDDSALTYAKIDGKDGVLLSFTKQSEYATATVAQNIQEEFEELCEETPGLAFTSLMDQGSYIEMVVDAVFQNLMMGAVLAIVILFLFLRDLRPTAIVACSIPISVLAALVLMYFSGVTLNAISLSGLAVGVGMLVDNSIVVIENTYRLRSEGVPVLRAAVAGAKQMAGSITASTLTTVCVFLPIVFVQGITRQLFTDMALTIAYSLLASLAVALTLIPALSSGVLRKDSSQKKEPKWFAWLVRLHERALHAALGHRAITLVLVVFLLFGSTALAIARGFEFIPEIESNQLMVSLEMPEGTSFEDACALADAASERIQEINGIKTVGTMQASGMGSILGISQGASNGSTSMTMYVILDSEKSMWETSSVIVNACADLPCTVNVQSSSGMDSASALLGGEGIHIDLYGDDLDALYEAADTIGKQLKAVEGVEEVDNGIQDTTPELRIVVDKQKAYEHGLTVAQVYQKVAAALSTELTATTIQLDGNQTEIIVQRPYEYLSIAELRSMVLRIEQSDGTIEEVPLTDIATFEDAVSLNAINRSEKRRTIAVTATVADGLNVGHVTLAAQEQLENIELPAGVTMEFAGENESTMAAMQDLLWMLLLGIVIVYLIMVAEFQSLLLPFIVLFTVPLAITGGMLGLLLTGIHLSVVAMIGAVMLVGVVVNNGIVLIDTIQQLRREGMDRRDAIAAAGRIRLRPVLMTALTTILGLLPLGMGLGMGASLMQPVAIVCIGGLLYATIMTLVVVPVMYDILCKKPPHRITDEMLELDLLPQENILQQMEK